MKNIIGLSAIALTITALVACSKGFETRGNDGTSCTAIQELTGVRIQCTDGTTTFVNNGVNGSNGSNGTNGVDGTNGVNGTNGTDATPVTSVQFCPGTPSYPSTFPEVGLCIGGNIYAVYSANDGFLTYIPPGAYTSNAIGSTCNFVVTNNCGVTN